MGTKRGRLDKQLTLECAFLCHCSETFLCGLVCRTALVQTALHADISLFYMKHLQDAGGLTFLNASQKQKVVVGIEKCV